MSDLGDGWQTVMPTSQAGIDRLSRSQLEAYERKILKEWASSRGSWSGVGKHTSAVDFSEAKKLHHGRFKHAVDRVLGSGAYGVVEKVHYTNNNKSVVLARKFIQYRRGRTIQILREEARVMEKLDHEHIVNLVGTYSTRPNELYLLLWPAAACNLTSLIDDIEALRSGQGDRDDIINRMAGLELKDFSAVDRRHDPALPLAKREACPLKYLHQIMGCVTEAVRYCHDEKIRHLDLKPSNILLTPTKVYLADFGIARDVNDRDHTKTFGVQGTPKWRAPEICNPDDEWSMQAADVYSLGLVLLNIAAILYGSSLADFDAILDDLALHTRADRLQKYHAKLQLEALATQDYADNNASTFAPKHIVGLTSRMLSPDASQRPTAEEVDLELVELGGIDQIYHNACCRKSSRAVTTLMDNRFRRMAVENADLRAKGERMEKRLRELEGRDETYQMRLDNERRQHAEKMAAMQRRLEEEQKERKRLETILGEMQNGRRQRPGLPRPERSASNGQNGVLMMRRPQTHPPPQHAANKPPYTPTVSFHTKAQIRPISPTSGRRPDYHPLRTATDPPPTNGTPSPGGPDGNFPLRSRGSGSRLPVAVHPSTPMRSRSGTPSLQRDASLTDSTQFSMASSTFSRRSGVSSTLEPESAAPSPVLKSLPAAVAVRPADGGGVGLGLAPGSVDGSLSGKGGVGRERERAGSVVSSSANGPPRTASPLLSGSALSSPRTARAELEPLAGGVRVPPLPTALSWADVARSKR